MPHAAATRYQAVQITTSDPGAILIALFDGLFKFLLQAQHALRSGRRPAGSEAISRAHAILSELLVALDPRHSPQLCANLSGLYNFALSRLLYASRSGDVAAIDEVVRVLAPVREAFTTVVKNQKQAGAAPITVFEAR